MPIPVHLLLNGGGTLARSEIVPRIVAPVNVTSETHPVRESLSVSTIIVADQIARRRIPRKCLGDLLCQPLRRGMLGYREPEKLSATVAHDQKRQTGTRTSGSEPGKDRQPRSSSCSRLRNDSYATFPLSSLSLSEVEKSSHHSAMSAVFRAAVTQYQDAFASAIANRPGPNLKSGSKTSASTRRIFMLSVRSEFQNPKGSVAELQCHRNGLGCSQL